MIRTHEKILASEGKNALKPMIEMTMEAVLKM